MKSHNNFNGTTCRIEEIREAYEPKASHVDDMGNATANGKLQFLISENSVGIPRFLINCDVKSQLVRISTIARRPVSGLWTLNYTTNSSTEAMIDGNRYYWRVRALDGGGEQ